MTKSKMKGERKGAPPAELVGRVTLKGAALESARIAFWTHVVQYRARDAANAALRRRQDKKGKRASVEADAALAKAMATMNVLGGNGTETKRVTLGGEHLRQLRWAAARYTSLGAATGRRYDDSVRSGEGAWKMLAALFASAS